MACSSSSRTRTVPPSPMTNPSRLALNGREAVSGASFLVESACIALKPPTAAALMVASDPPDTITFALLSLMRLNASTIEFVDEAQADTVA